MHRNEGENAAWTVDGKSGFRTSPPYTVMTPEWAQAVQEEIMTVIERYGLPILSQGNDTKDQLYNAISSRSQDFNYYVTSQATFVNLFERTAANTYKIKSDYKSVYFKNLDGGFSVASLLSGGDTWGDLYTNVCSHMEFENGAYIGFGALKGNLTVETDGCYLKNVDVRGTSSSAAIIESFKLNAYRVTYDNCKCSARLSSVDMVGFQGSATAAHNATSRYVNCTVYSLTGVDKVYGFKDCYNLTSCIVYNLNNSTTADYCIGFESCYNLTTCYANGIDNSNIAFSASGFRNCYNLTSCISEDIDNTSGFARGFYSCYNLTSCIARDIDATTGTAEGFYDCHYLAACYSTDIDTTAGTSNGFSACSYGSSLFTDEAANPTNDWIDTVDASITNKVSTPSVWT